MVSFWPSKATRAFNVGQIGEGAVEARGEGSGNAVRSNPHNIRDAARRLVRFRLAPVATETAPVLVKVCMLALSPAAAEREAATVG